MNDEKDDVPGTGQEENQQNKPYLSFEEARAFVRRLGLKTQKEWFTWGASNQRPSEIPKWPETTYPEYIDVRDWLGTKKAYRSFEEAREYARSLGIDRTADAVPVHGGLRHLRRGLAPAR